MQLKKLAVLCNACFWLTLLFQVWEHARGIHQSILNTVVVLGILAVLVNLAWIIVSKISSVKKINSQPAEKGEVDKPTAERVFNVFNLFSFIAQVILLAIKLL